MSRTDWLSEHSVQVRHAHLSGKQKHMKISLCDKVTDIRQIPTADPSVLVDDVLRNVFVFGPRSNGILQDEEEVKTRHERRRNVDVVLQSLRGVVPQTVSRVGPRRTALVVGESRSMNQISNYMNNWHLFTAGDLLA